ncbi:PREDICTED: cytochrome P450 9e2-like [Nicrophorus vespilloides]|uniref:Cytochrome P450 9e2-like n=1 Tax=Nicrophorus vespilloides TaxID=110193 RepID=A0ABM1MPC3_NICVS|nr:PREDICTED: cytochrome P450 9e2-like [Nicrophorus vespilloides]
MFWLLLGLLFIILYLYNYKKLNYWTNKGVKQKKTFLLYELYKMFFMKKSFVELLQDTYNEFPDSRYSGSFQLYSPLLVLKDSELIKQITVKDFEHFTDHINLVPEGIEPLWTSNLFALKGDKWRDMRATLSPAFTSSKMRAMFALMSDCAQEVAKYFENHQGESKSIELRDLFTRYTNDVIATCAFGVQCNSIKQRNNEFYLMGNLATDFTGIWKITKLLIYMMLPKLSKILGFSFFEKSVSIFFRRIIKDTIKMREENNVTRPDMIHLLMDARKGQLNYDENIAIQDAGFAAVEESEIGKTVKKVKDVITDDDITAQALIFFFAGFDSVATLMVLMAYELAVHPDIQERLQNEIDIVLEENDGKITYDAINKMKYLDMVTSETLRKWPPNIVINRVCVKPYTIPAVLPDEIPVTLQVGDAISVPVYGIHRDPKNYPNPEKFDPERFNDENKVNIEAYTYLPFGSGPRNCIGSRFALIETKVVYIHLLAKFNIVVTEKSEIPVKLSKTGFNFNSKNGFWFGLKLRDS